MTVFSSITFSTPVEESRYSTLIATLSVRTDLSEPVYVRGIPTVSKNALSSKVTEFVGDALIL